MSLLYTPSKRIKIRPKIDCTWEELKNHLYGFIGSVDKLDKVLKTEGQKYSKLDEVNKRLGNNLYSLIAVSEFPYINESGRIQRILQELATKKNEKYRLKHEFEERKKEDLRELEESRKKDLDSLITVGGVFGWVFTFGPAVILAYEKIISSEVAVAMIVGGPITGIILALLYYNSEGKKINYRKKAIENRSFDEGSFNKRYDIACARSSREILENSKRLVNKIYSY